MTADELSLDTPESLWRDQMRRLLRGDQIAPADIVPPPEVTLGMILRSGARRYVDSETGIGLGGMLYDGDAETGWKVVEVKASLPPAKGTRIEWHTLTDDEVDWTLYQGFINRKVVKDLRGALIRHMRDRPDDRRYMAALNTIQYVLS